MSPFLYLKLTQVPSKPKADYELGHPTEVPLPENKAEGLSLEVSDLIGNESMFLFDVLNFNSQWLHLHVSEWKTNESYLEMYEFVKHLKTTNETAERGVKLVTDYAYSLTKNQKEKQNILHVVQAHRSYHLGQKKSNFSCAPSDIFHR